MAEQKTIELTKSMIQAFNNKETVFLHDCEHARISITRVANVCLSERVQGKKHGLYRPSKIDIGNINTGKKTLFYDGMVQVFIHNKTGEELVW